MILFPQPLGKAGPSGFPPVAEKGRLPPLTVVDIQAKNTAPCFASGSQKAGCAKRGLHYMTADKITPSVALGGRDRGISEGDGPKMPRALNRILEGLIPGIPADWVQSSVGSGMRMIWTSWRLMPGSSWAPKAKGVTDWPVALESSAARWAARSTSCCWMVMEISARM